MSPTVADAATVAGDGEAVSESTAPVSRPRREGWFVVNVRDAVWDTHDVFGSSCMFESPEPSSSELGIRLTVLEPGQPNGLYHREATQEDFLVLSGECTLLVEGEERRLRAWDFVHCPPRHDAHLRRLRQRPCVILMTGARRQGRPILYPVSELALRHGAGVEVATSSPAEAYAGYPDERFERPESWDALPWNRSR